MKSPVALCLASVLTLLYVVFRMLTVSARAVPSSEVALIQYAIGHRGGFGDDRPTHGVDTAFRSFGGRKPPAHEERKRTLCQALAANPKKGFLAPVDVTRLLRPNTSSDLRRLRQQLAQANGRVTPTLLVTFSAPAPLPDGSTCYYVEEQQQGLGRQMGSAAIYVVRKGAVVSIVPVWTN